MPLRYIQPHVYRMRRLPQSISLTSCPRGTPMKTAAMDNVPPVFTNRAFITVYVNLELNRDL